MEKYVLLLELGCSEFVVATKPTTDHAALCRIGDRLQSAGIGYVICGTDNVNNYICK